MSRIRWMLLTTAALVVIGAALLTMFPSQAACRDSGRTVDPTERHCVAADGYVQLREHVLFHTVQVLTVAAPIAGLGWWVVRRQSRRRAARAV